MNSRTTGILALILAATAQAAGPDANTIIPAPEKIEFREGTFKLLPESKILAADAARETAQFLAARLGRSTGYKLEIVAATDNPPAGSIVLTLGGAAGPEGYELTADKNAVIIRAADSAGLFYGVQSLFQLFPPRVYSPSLATGVDWQIPCVQIQDQPRFKWRGLLVDPSRHFWTKDEIKRYLDLMAVHKLNSLQMHLTDHDGWRVEIKKYPKLTTVGAWRGDIGYDLDPRSSTAYGPDGRYGGFYSQEDVREIVKYAQSLHINIVPEIEMPGHFGAAVESYPELTCSTPAGQPAGNIGVCCPGNDETFTFLEGVLTEVMELFPSKFIHIGGDEVDRANWHQCPNCQARMKAENLKNEDELQSFIIRHIDKFLTSKGRRLVGWSEIRQGGLASNAVMMDWIGGGAESAAEGHDVIMAPTTYCYFDYFQSLDYSIQPRAWGGILPLREAYAFDPIPDSLATEHYAHVLGGQANLWAEAIASPRHLDLMTYPRACALSEVLWSPKAARNFADFSRRLQNHQARLDRLGVNYYSDRARKIGEWAPAQLTSAELTLEWDATPAMAGSGSYHVVLDHTAGGALKVAWVALLDNGQEIARDTHAGYAGPLNSKDVPRDPHFRNVVYILNLANPSRDHKYTIQAHVTADSGSDSQGVVTMNPAVRPVVR